MTKIFKNMAPYWYMIVAIVLLLIVQAFGDLSAVTGTAGGAIQIDTGRVDVQPVQTGLQQYGDM